MAIGLLMALAALCGADELRVNAKRKNLAAQAQDQGAYLKRMEYGECQKIDHEISDNWFTGDKSMFPEEYRKYFEINLDARISYELSLRSLEEIKRGYQPSNCCVYNRYTFDAFGMFNFLYKENIKIFNETGVYYYR